MTEEARNISAEEFCDRLDKAPWWTLTNDIHFLGMFLLRTPDGLFRSPNPLNMTHNEYMAFLEKAQEVENNRRLARMLGLEIADAVITLNDSFRREPHIRTHSEWLQKYANQIPQEKDG